MERVKVIEHGRMALLHCLDGPDSACDGETDGGHAHSHSPFHR
jgi:hypothetical protein